MANLHEQKKYAGALK